MDEDLRELANGVVDDLFRAEQCEALYQRISDHRKPLNNDGFGDLFGTLQGFLVSELILALTRTFEKPGKRYANRSLRTTVEFIEQKADELKIKNRDLLKQGLRDLSVAQDELDDAPDKDLNLLAAEVFGELLPGPEEDCELGKALSALRTIRDKQLAHHEHLDADEFPKATWGDVSKLLDVPKTILGIIGNAYLNTAWVDAEGNFILTSNAERASRSLHRLFEKAGVAD